MSTSAKIIMDSISEDGDRLTTFEVTFHRFVLAEFNTHRVFSRNSASSRAIPLSRQLVRVRDQTAYPVVFPAEQKGMQGGGSIGERGEYVAGGIWREAAEAAADCAERLGELGVHKSVANRLLEPFMWHTVVVTSTAWENFFDQRWHEAAQPEIRVAAEMMRAAYDASTPGVVREHQWHTPYFDWTANSPDLEALEALGNGDNGAEWYVRQAAQISAARCARVSYLTQGGQRDIQQDLDLYARLSDRQKDAAHANDPIHWSPLEHVATPWAWNRQEGCIHFGQDPEAAHDTFTCVPLDHLPRTGNLLGWRSLRTTVEAERQQITYR